MSDHSVLIVRALDDCIYWASLLTETTVYAFSHVDVITSSPSRTIGTRLTFDSDCISWAGGCTKFTGNAPILLFDVPFFSSSISSESMLSSEFGRKRTFFIRIMDCPFRLEGIEEGAEEHGIIVLWADPLSYLERIHFHRRRLIHQ